VRRALAAAAAALALGVAACGGEEEDAAPVAGEGPVRTVERTTRVEVIRRASEGGAFDPQAIYAREAPGVVTVFSEFSGDDEAPAPEEDGGGGQGVGSGFVLSGRGEIATNAHVVTEGEGGAVRPARGVFVQFADRNQVPARIVGFDPNSDVALLRVDPAGLTLRPLPLGSSRNLRVGEAVAAIGSPYGEPQSLSVGVISGLDRSIQSLTGFAISGAIQTDAAINRGNSGGPLVDERGEVLGINSQIRSSGGGSEGVGFAVPVDTVRRVLDELRRDGEVDYAFLGVSTTALYPQLAERFGLPVRAGAWVQEITTGGPAARAGLRAGSDEERFQAQDFRVGGDVITRIEDRPLRDPDDLSAALTRFAPGRTVRLEVYRGRERREVRVQLGERPDQTRP
jgi:S1-C subfamily serine protease